MALARSLWNIAAAVQCWRCYIWLRVTVIEERRSAKVKQRCFFFFPFFLLFSFFFFFLFFLYIFIFSYPHPSPPAQRVCAHELGSSSTMLCCICKRGRLHRGNGRPVVSIRPSIFYLKDLYAQRNEILQNF